MFVNSWASSVHKSESEPSGGLGWKDWLLAAASFLHKEKFPFPSEM
jgi:hypothetical protein